MALTTELIDAFVKVTNDKTEEKSESTVYGTIVDYEGSRYVRIDGSDLLTPISLSADAIAGERVTVMIKNHTAVVTGNMSSPAARKASVNELGTQITEVEILMADKVSTEQLNAANGRIDTLLSDNVLIRQSLTASQALIDELTAKNVEITGKLTAAEGNIDKLQTTKLDASIADIKYAFVDDLDATNAEIYNLQGTYAEFQETVTKNFEAQNAEIATIKAGQITVESLEGKFATLDFANITEAAIETFFSKSGMIENLVVGEGTITGNLVGVTISGDLIEGNTIKADKLVVKGSDGLYYKLNVEAGATTSEQVTEEQLQNGLSGSVIIAKSITADRISVTDLVAFGATIGGFHITDAALYSGVKSSVDNTTSGIYLDNTGQVNIGDMANFIKYYQHDDGTWAIDISADSMTIGVGGRVASITDVNDIITPAVQNSEDRINETLTEYTKTSEFDAYQETVKNDIANVEQTVSDNQQAMKDELDRVEDKVDTNEANNRKYFDYRDDGLTIRGGGNDSTLNLDTDGITLKRGETVMGKWDQNYFYAGNIYIRTNEQARFGDFAFKPEENGSLTFGKVGG